MFLQAQIPGSGISDRQRFVATLKNYIQICANPEESKTILGTDEDELDDEEEIPASESDDSFDVNFNLSSIKCTSSTSASSISNSTVSSSALTTSIVPSTVANKKSIYTIADIKNSAIVDSKFSAINLNFGEDKWEAFGKCYSPSQLQLENYDLISSKSPFWNYLSPVCKFIFSKIENIFPYVMPNRHVWEVSVVFAQKYPQMEEMFKRYKNTHSKATKFVDVAVCIK